MEHTSTNMAIIGGGIAGAWLGYRLAQRGIETVIIQSNSDPDTPRVSERAAVVINSRLLDGVINSPLPGGGADLSSLLADETGTQDPELQPMIQSYLGQ